MKKTILISVLIILVGITLYKFSKQKTVNQIEPDCEAKVSSSSEVFENFTNIPNEVDFSDFPEAKTYFTRITESVKKGVNFAGHYVLIPIGCGTDCVLFAIVDAKNGKVIAYNSGEANYHLRNGGNYFVLEPVFARQTRKFYKIDKDNNLRVVFTETAIKDYYTSPE